MNQSKKKAPRKKLKAGLIALIGVFVLAVFVGIALAVVNSGAKGDDIAAQTTPSESAANSAKEQKAAVVTGKDIVIDKSKITEKAAFFPYQSGDIKMEVLAVKAPDGTIRTAMNTCQVCYNSGAGYYVQEGDELVCQNCGNRFNISKVEKIKNGCNPVPITSDYKTEDDSTITIQAAFMDANKELFADWKR